MDEDNKDVLKASVAGTVERVNQLICVRPIKCRYMGEIGDVVVGRITEVQQKRWKVETNSRLDSVLLISSVNLPGGELVILIFHLLPVLFHLYFCRTLLTGICCLSLCFREEDLQRTSK